MNSYIRAIVRTFLFFLGMNTYELYSDQYKYVKSEREIYADKVSYEFIDEVRKEYSLSLEGYGGSMPEKIESIEIMFESKNKATINDARWLLISLKEKFANKINNNQKIRPFLAEYPFSLARAKICISFQEGNESNTVDYVHVGKNKVFYCKLNQTDGSYEHMLVESFDDALKEFDSSKTPLIFNKSIK